MTYLGRYRIVGNFQGEISLWFSIIKFIHGKKFVGLHLGAVSIKP